MRLTELPAPRSQATPCLHSRGIGSGIRISASTPRQYNKKQQLPLALATPRRPDVLSDPVGLKTCAHSENNTCEIQVARINNSESQKIKNPQITPHVLRSSVPRKSARIHGNRKIPSTKTRGRLEGTSQKHTNRFPPGLDCKRTEFPGEHGCKIARGPGLALSPLGAAPAKCSHGKLLVRNMANSRQICRKWRNVG